MTTTQHYDSPVTIAQDTRKALRSAFPATKFSLTGSRGTGYGWLNLSWTDGPTNEQVAAITDEFDARLGGYTHINSSRHFSAAAEAWAQTQIEAHPGYWYSDYDQDGATYYAGRKCLADHDLTGII